MNPDDMNLDEIARMSFRMRLAMRMYHIGTPMATPMEFQRVAEAAAGTGHPEETVIMSNVVATVQLQFEDLGLKFSNEDPLLVEAILDTCGADLRNDHPEIRRIARHSWLLYMEYQKREQKRAGGLKARP